VISVNYCALPNTSPGRNEYKAEKSYLGIIPKIYRYQQLRLDQFTIYLAGSSKVSGTHDNQKVPRSNSETSYYETFLEVLQGTLYIWSPQICLEI
jgi:hypothetical protein